MKKIMNILGAAVLVLTASSCQDWLDMPSESKADSSTVFSTLSRAEMAVMGAYSSLHTQELGYQLLMGTDECTSTESNSKYNVANYDYTNTSGMLSKTYTEMYKAIEYSNVCIKNLPLMSVSESEQEKLNALLGESLAIRAYAYWNIVRFYGDVPYTDIPTSDLTTFSSSRVSRDTIYDHCISDLQRAIELLPWRSEGMVETPERFTKNAAYGILARVALYAAGYSLRWDLSTVPYNASTCRIAQRDDQTRIRELYQIAADACKAVITKGENSLLEDYDEIFRDLGNQRYNNETMFEFGWYGANSSDVRTGYTNGIPTSGTDNEVLGKGGSQMIAMPTFYFEYEEGDQRRDVSICNYGLRLSTGNNAYQMNTFAGMGVGKYRINWKNSRGTSDSRRDINWPLLRYSDVLLMYAEALNELNNGATSEAVDAVREVRMRAFRNDEAKVGDIPTGYEDFKNYIIQERKLELSNEGLRKSDLARWGILVDYLTAEKEKLVQLAKREGKYANVEVYRAYKLSAVPTLNDPTIALSYIPMTEEEVASILTDEELATLHVLNSGASGAVVKDFYEDADGNVYYTEQPGTTAVEYTILNMFSINTIKQKGNLSVEDVEGVSSNNPWITGTSGVYYGMKKNMVEILPFNTTNIIDVNPGLAEQQHPCY
ncbi:RagB/SusD domain-containing protein [Phocaeicola salanitronis DSM 18170]|uniref:RagB/SusD domain-containing protein n=1 Tax=Phocaeicola salanitronis (strain DSM 18170 / JCM 13657 / CCUG 60908 / BL78) TaxID=667015 RepID=F0QZ86_PHOSB|nr:RagB/SusD family nutrient uptake outer membrane protein [Phocaeicola salanitronis]ADY37133.1 RagB/SusD domain-containing protein [Phocaeicola salanitronis DSM 18170]